MLITRRGHNWNNVLSQPTNSLTVVTRMDTPKSGTRWETGTYYFNLYSYYFSCLLGQLTIGSCHVDNIGQNKVDTPKYDAFGKVSVL